MKIITKILVLGVLLLFCSCDDDDNPSPVYSLNSETYKGFLFEDMKIIDFPNSINLKPDFFVLAQTNDTGDVLSPFLSHPDMESRFVLIAEFQDLESAQGFYDSYLTPEDKPLQQFALNIKPFQIWLIKTNTEKLGKILITETKTSNINNKPFAEMKFKASKMN
jgi:hypothetical protein